MELYTHIYDSQNRLLTTKHQLNEGTEMTLVDNTYDELGRLVTNERNGQQNLQTEYTYNVRSWMKSITGDLFTQTLYYNDTRGGNTPSYSGNISAMDWKATDALLRGYNFGYDNLSRLTSANYLENNVASTKFNTAYSYDKHGNMLSLTRSGNQGTTTYGVIDNLTLTYQGNQLVKVEDSAANPSTNLSMDFRNGTNQVIEYTYDGNGNQTQDLNKGINKIEYNFLNLPRRIEFSQTGSLKNEYVYSATGAKLAVTHTKSSISKRTDYVGNMIYENGNLKRILVDGGYIENGQYHFYIQDHLGNNRVVANQNGAVVQVNHYYPFGMSFAEGGVDRSKQPYQYNGKELDEENGLNWYDYEARQKSDWGFTGIDPQADKYVSWSPYVYCMNNPINAIDPDGRDIIVLQDREGALGFGHTAILIGNDTDGWRYLSKDGGIGIIVSGRSKIGEKRFDNIPQFNNSNYAAEYHGYRARARFATTKEQDEAAYAAMWKEVNSWYDFTAMNCMDAVATALQAAGLYAEKSYYMGTDNPHADPVLIGEPKPNIRYDRLIKNEHNKKYITETTENANPQYNKSDTWDELRTLLGQWLTINPNMLFQMPL